MPESALEDVELHKGLNILINIGEKLVVKCEKNKDIDGFGKLLKNCKAELNYLKKLPERRKFTEAVLKSTNLSNLQGIVLCAENLPDVTGILRPIQISNSHHSIVVDVVCNDGRTWVKVVTKNSKALLANANEQCHFGTKSIKDQAVRYIECAKLHLHHFKVPEVMFVFVHQVPPKMEASLTRLGVKVCRGEDIVARDVLMSELCSNVFASLILPSKTPSDSKSTKLKFSDCDDDSDSTDDDDDDDDGDDSSDEIAEKSYISQEDDVTDVSLSKSSGPAASFSFLKSLCSDTSCLCKSYIKDLYINSPNVFPHIQKVNLDVTSMIAIVSNLCHSRCNFTFKESYLSLQAKDERSSPTLPGVFALLLNKTIYACQTAVSDFEKIVKVVGGEDEQVRAEALLKGIQVISDGSSPKSEKLRESARINPRMRTIFGTGDGIEAVTSTANNGFIRASRQAGVEFVAFIHSARALTQQKEKAANKLDCL